MNGAKKSVATPRRREPTSPVRAGDPESRRRAAAVLEVLGGVCSPPGAAESLGISLPRYYALEQRALEGLVASCAPPERRGRRVTPTRELERLRARVATLERESARYQAMVRMTNRAAGLPSPSTKAAEGGGKPGKGKRGRRPTVRALALAQALRGPAAEPGGATSAAKPGETGSPLPAKSAVGS